MSSAAKIGAFMLGVLGILAFFILKIEDIRVGGGALRRVTVNFDNVAGLEERASVRIAGVRKGTVRGVRVLSNGQAQVTMDIQDDVPLYADASAKIANLGLLGEKYVEIDPGTPNQPLLTGDGVALRTGSQSASIEDVTTQISEIAKDVKAVTESMRAVMAGPDGQQRLEQILESVRVVTVQMRELIEANRGNVDVTLTNVRQLSEALNTEIPRISRSIEETVRLISGTVGENRADVRELLDNLRDLSRDLKSSAVNIGDITDQVKSGQGSVGKLLYSDEAHEKLTSALASVEGGVNELRNTIGRAARMRLDLGIQGTAYAGLNHSLITDEIGGYSRAEVNVRLTPDPERNRFYNLVLADDPRGARQDKIFEEIVTDPVTGQTTRKLTHTIKYDRDFLISAQAGWNLEPFTVRIGLFDSTGGAGVDYAVNERVRMTGEAFDFGKKRDDSPHLRLRGEYVFRREQPRTPAIFVTAGVDNPLNDTAFTFGGGIRWRDDDLKYLLSSVPVK